MFRLATRGPSAARRCFSSTPVCATRTPSRPAASATATLLQPCRALRVPVSGGAPWTRRAYSSTAGRASPATPAAPAVARAAPRLKRSASHIEKVTTAQKRKDNAARFLGVAVTGGAAFFLASNYEELLDKWNGTFEDLKQPFKDDLLPPAPFAGTRTLVLDLEDTLVHYEWDRAHGWRCARRPYLTEFLEYLSQYYEIVVFSSNSSFIAEQWIEQIDPIKYTPAAMIQHVSHRLFRESTLYENGVWKKDLSKLSRDLSKVLVVDKDALAEWQMFPNNAIPINAWTGDPEDHALLDLIPFLEDIVKRDVKDVRETMARYSGKDLATAFKNSQREDRKTISKLRAQPGGGSVGLGRAGSSGADVLFFLQQCVSNVTTAELRSGAVQLTPPRIGYMPRERSNPQSVEEQLRENRKQVLDGIVDDGSSNVEVMGFKVPLPNPLDMMQDQGDKGASIVPLDDSTAESPAAAAAPAAAPAAPAQKPRMSFRQ